MNNQQRQQVLDQIKQANNVLVAVSANPTVDELAASIGLTIALNKMDKHATTVFSGVVPSTIEFLQPEKTIETTTDSLRDFIIALDKSKADKLRYKVENDVVRIFITPYRTSITDHDLDFSQGDFNVDVVVALGVSRKEDLDRAVTAHGRILHDATVVSMTKGDSVSELGSINWQGHQASSLCEMVAGLTTEIAPEAIDGQMATALLTGIIAETDRFKNERTTPLALSLSSKLMTAGANQKLIAEKLEEPAPAPAPRHEVYGSERDEEIEDVAKTLNDGSLQISHDDENHVDNIHIDEHGNLGSDRPVEEFNNAPEHHREQVSSLPLVDEPVPPAPEPSQLPPSHDLGREALPEPSTDSHSLDDPDHPDYLEQPTLPTPSSNRPVLQHEKVVVPLSEVGKEPKTDKPFDLTEAMQEANAIGGGVNAPPVTAAAQQPPANPAPNAAPAAAPQPVSSSIPPPPPVAPAPSRDKTLTELEASIDAATTMPPQAAPATTVPLPAPAPAPTTVSAPPPVPPPMTAPQFYDGDGQNANPFLNPAK